MAKHHSDNDGIDEVEITDATAEENGDADVAEIESDSVTGVANGDDATAAANEALPEKQQSEKRSGSVTLWVAVVALLLALGALGAALYPLLATEDVDVDVALTDEEVAAAKTHACDSFAMARGAILARSTADPGENPDPVTLEILGANARDAFATAGPYLRNSILLATPENLTTAISDFADQTGEIAVAQLAGVGPSDPALADRLTAISELEGKISTLCQ